MDGGFVDRFDELFAVGYRAAFVVLGQRAPRPRTAPRRPWPRAAVGSRHHAVIGAGRAPTSSTTRYARCAATTSCARLRALPARQREAVVLRYLVDLSEQETAQAMACTVGTVKSTTARGLDRLRASLGPSWALEQP